MDNGQWIMDNYPLSIINYPFKTRKEIKNGNETLSQRLSHKSTRDL